MSQHILAAFTPASGFAAVSPAKAIDIRSRRQFRSTRFTWFVFRPPKTFPPSTCPSESPCKYCPVVGSVVPHPVSGWQQMTSSALSYHPHDTLCYDTT